ncbi:hypothetical protein VKT23_002778 [Stygiomarasmius scandens]|uniref:Uncharacterized protein n=1 Tax=Marasmiellus scandens TaxID=2682957 RepID=A0ABR1JWQ2_9AGAR
MNATAVLRPSYIENKLAPAGSSQTKYAQKRFTPLPNTCRESKFVEMFSLEDEENWLQAAISSMPSASELPYLRESPSLPQNVATEDEGELEFDSYYFGKYDEEEQADQESDDITPLNCKIFPSPEALLAGSAELEKENIPFDPSCQVDFDPEEYFWAVWPQPLYVYDTRTKTKYLSAATIAQHQLKMDKEKAAAASKKSVLRKVFGSFANTC